jgi:hypothetical protein
MANEIETTSSLRINKNGFDQTFRDDFTQSTMTGNYVQDVVIEIGTSAENLPLGDITTPGWCRVKNLDATNFVQIGHDVAASFEADVKVPAGKTVLFYMAQGTPQAKADTAACKIHLTIAEA